jgi:hypothetical protein
MHPVGPAALDSGATLESAGVDLMDVYLPSKDVTLTQLENWGNVAPLVVLDIITLAMCSHVSGDCLQKKKNEVHISVVLVRYVGVPSVCGGARVCAWLQFHTLLTSDKLKIRPRAGHGAVTHMYKPLTGIVDIATP